MRTVEDILFDRFTLAIVTVMQLWPNSFLRLLAFTSVAVSLSGCVESTTGPNDTETQATATSVLTTSSTAAATSTTTTTILSSTTLNTAQNPFGGNSPEDRLMPDVVCMNLQEAQDEIQDHGVFLSRSEDATGAGRFQVFDRNWIVIRQTPKPGTQIEELEAVLYVVKIGESTGGVC